MRRKPERLAVAAALAVLLACRALAEEKPADWKPVEEALGKPGELAKDGSFKVTSLRTDVSVKSRGMPVPAGLGLNSYAAFAGTPGKATVVGDTCLLVHEVNPAIDALRAGEIEVVAIHNHMLADEPRLIFLHFQGHGEAAKLAAAIRRSWDLLGKTKAPEPPAPSPEKELDTKAIASALGRAGPPAKDGVYKVTLPRTDLEVSLDGERLPASVGLACWAAFSSCSCGRTIVMGDTCVRRAELQGTIDALRKNAIEITSIHNHLLGQSSDVMFMHIEGEGDAAALARGVRAAWDTLAVSRLAAAKPGALVLSFDADEAGKAPRDFSSALTGGGGAVSWLVEKDASAPSAPNVLVQTSQDETDHRFPLCIYDKVSATDVRVSVRFKAVEGKVDRAAGLVVRLADKDNYYVTRANALEDNVRFYKVVAGSRQQLAGANLKVSSAEWHALSLTARGTHFEVAFDGKVVITADDDTMKGAGKVGVWTKADSVTRFDDLSIEALDGAK